MDKISICASSAPDTAYHLVILPICVCRWHHPIPLHWISDRGQPKYAHTQRVNAPVYSPSQPRRAPHKPHYRIGDTFLSPAMPSSLKSSHRGFSAEIRPLSPTPDSTGNPPGRPLTLREARDRAIRTPNIGSICPNVSDSVSFRLFECGNVCGASDYVSLCDLVSTYV